MSLARPFVGILTCAIALTLALAAQAQEQAGDSLPLTGIAEYVRLSDDVTVANGQIIVLTPEGYRLAEEPYSPQLAGVITTHPAIAISYVGSLGAHPLIASGTALVRVSTSNGDIAAGDFITSSDEPGIGMKATQGGYVIGTAQAAVTGTDTGIIPVTVNIEFAVPGDRAVTGSDLSLADYATNALTVGLRAAANEPNTALRYAIAALVLIVSIGFGFIAFGRSATNGVAAMGRNPLARKSIFVITSFNLLITIAFAAAGLALSLYILAF